VLKRVAELLRNNTRAADISGRLGGDEFVLVVSHTSAEDIVRAVERMREEIACERILSHGKEVRITASFGIAGFQTIGMPEFKQLMERADCALYAAKQAGRNQVKME
jgi:diguanylate cyclase (GGDEF)-like protein